MNQWAGEVEVEGEVGEVEEAREEVSSQIHTSLQALI